jgi:predicted dehydrogenase
VARLGYRAVVIGAGNIGITHLKAAQRLNEIETVAVSDTLPERLSQAAEQFGIRGYEDYRDMIAKEKPDIAVVALPPFLHRDAAVFCAEQGCHILLEKPMAMNQAQCDEIIEAARRNCVTLMIGHTVHYMPADRKVKEIVDSGTLGKLIMMNDRRYVSYFDNRLDWFFKKETSGGGILFNLGSHSIDKLQWFTGSRVKKVKAFTDHTASPGDIEGAGTVFAETESGVPGIIFHSGYGGVGTNETELIFTEGILKLDYRVMIGRNKEWREVELDRQDPYVLQFEDLIRCIHTGEEPSCSGEYAKSIIAAIEAIYESSGTGTETVVR